MSRWRESYQDISGSLKTEGSFVQNAAWMFASSGISIIIQFVFFYLLARIYGPAAYGVFGLFNFYAATLGNSATLGYNQAFVIPAGQNEFSALLRLTTWIAVLFSLLVLIVSLAAGPGILRLFGHEELGAYIYLVAPACLFFATDRITADWAIRNKEFRRQTICSTSVTVVSRTFNVLYGWKVSATTAGLIGTTILHHLLRTISYALFVISDFRQRIRDRISFAELKNTASKFRNYPFFVYWANVLDVFSNTLPAALLVTLGFDIEFAGYYGYAVVLLDLPLRLLGSGISSVFMQKSAEVSRERGEELAALTWRLYRNMLFISLAFTFVVFIGGEFLYVSLLGEKWRIAGQAAGILVIGYCFRLISAPLASVFNVLRREREYFFFQVGLATARFLSLVVPVIMNQGISFIDLLLFYSIGNAACYFYLALRISGITKIGMGLMINLTLISASIVFGLAFVIKHFI